jgi:hypothetical protein
MVRITASLGVAVCTDGHEDALVVEAEAALYDAKRKDKNRTGKARAERRIPREGGSLCKMGLLDDAIREHLELKRRRGADPTEIERAEREALGPVRRSPELPPDELPSHPPDEDAPVHAPGEALPPGYEPHDGEEGWEPLHDDVALDERAFHNQQDLPAYESDIPSAAESLPAPEPDLHYPAERGPGPAESAPEVKPTIPADRPLPAAADHLEQETEEYELEPENEAEGDMLESTPEFLQDTPDHDRLWFEQRPPRDFDFDG